MEHIHTQEPDQIYFTSFRSSVAQILEAHHAALTAKEIAHRMGYKTDRVTLFRTLKLFEQKQMIHRIATHDGVIRYRWGNREAHAHFFCTVCRVVYCVPQPEIHFTHLPSFTITGHQTNLSGCCSQCQNSNS